MRGSASAFGSGSRSAACYGRHVRDPGLCLAVVTAACVVVACTERVPDAAEDSGPSFVSLVPTANADYQIVDMASAHGAYMLELAVAADADMDAIARQLIEPVRSEYAEILVYFYDRDGDDELPMRRVQWTPKGGYAVRSYGTP